MKFNMLLGTAAAVAIAAGAQAQDDFTPSGDEKLTIVSWGGAYSESQDKAYHEPYEEEFGVEILTEDKSANALAGIRSQVEAGNVTWDIVDMLQADALRACDEGLLIEIPHDEWLAEGPDGSPASEDFIEDTLGDCFVPQILYATMFAYNTEAFEGEGPQTIEDIWNCEKFPGTRALEKIPQKNLEWALIADGVPAEEVYDVLATDEGQDQAFASLEALQSQEGCDVIWWSEGAQPPQMLADEEAVIATAFNGRIFNAQVSEDQPFEIIWDKQMFEVDGWVVPVGNEDDLPLIKHYLKWATDTQRLADQAKFISYGPARASSDALVSTHAETGVEMAPHMPTNPENFEKAVRFDTSFWADYGDALEERFTAWLSE
ncbi:MAG TPA: extracellular solute-binding protein [Thermohalobaculum sp.]|nr:extracellular solute-binding protein [Thermohalobaculum sp.]